MTSSEGRIRRTAKPLIESFSTAWALSVLAAALGLVSCNNDKIEVYRIPKEGITRSHAGRIRRVAAGSCG